jgi:hypothetical protein
MGFPPPPDAPALAIQQQVALGTGFATPALVLPCGITIPSFKFAFGFAFDIDLAFFLPTFFFSLGFLCDLNNPIRLDAGIKWGGGRTPNNDPDPDLALDAATS